MNKTLVKSILIGGSVLILGTCAIQSARAAEFEGLKGYLGAGYYIDTGSHVQICKDGDCSSDPKTSPSARFGFFGSWDLDQGRRLRVGIDHHSNWFEGAPFNNNPELDKTEFMIDYEFCVIC